MPYILGPCGNQGSSEPWMKMETFSTDFGGNLRLNEPSPMKTRAPSEARLPNNRLLGLVDVQMVSKGEATFSVDANRHIMNERPSRIESPQPSMPKEAALFFA